jgi:SpoVK/Ycf46/Vps4 family AAA+-type ATPase
VSPAAGGLGAAGAAGLHPFAASVRAHIRAGYPLLYVVTPEEERAIELIRQAVAPGESWSRKVYIWSISRGLCTPDMKRVDRGDNRPELLLPALLESPEPAVFILEDFHYYLDERSNVAPMVIRQLRDLVGPFKSSRKTVVVLSPVLKLPSELEKDLTVLDLDPLDQQELLAVLEETVELVQGNPKVEINLEAGDREKLVKALQGLTKGEAENALAKLVVTTSRIDAEDVSLLVAEKEQVIRKSGILEFYSTPERFGQIGGLDELKRWLRERERGFTEAARQFGLPSPKGLLLVGVPGCGKSLSAKAVGAEWQMPLLKFDLGKVFASLVGQAEENMRKALKMAEAVAPCILWIDEIEKGLSGTQSGGDSGVSARVFGTFLTWMEENKRPVFTIATANDIDGLPPELLRKGRFDEVFFIDLPTAAERANILAIHLSRHHRDYRDYDLPALVAATEGFSGAELEQAVISALYGAFAQGETTQLQDRHLRDAVAATVPLSKSMGQRVKSLRDEARTKWRRAALDPDASAPAGAPAPGDIPTPAAKPRRVFEV